MAETTTKRPLKVVSRKTSKVEIVPLAKSQAKAPTIDKPVALKNRPKRKARGDEGAVIMEKTVQVKPSVEEKQVSKRAKTDKLVVLEDEVTEGKKSEDKVVKARTTKKQAAKAVVSARTKSAKSRPVSISAQRPQRSKSSSKARSPSPEEDADAVDLGVAEDAENTQEDEDSVHMFGFSTDDDDSSDDEAMNEDEAPGIDVKKLPTIVKDDQVVKQKLEKAKRKPTTDRGVIYLGRVPHGFYEDQMRSYFKQFGDVTRLRLSRNKRTGKSKHYAFIEFESASVAQIVAETMDNYLLMGHILTCKVIPKEEVHAELWIGANRKWRKIPQDRIARLEHNKPRTKQEQQRAEKRLLERQEQKKRRLVEVGIDYDFDGIAYKKNPKPTET